MYIFHISPLIKISLPNPQILSYFSQNNAKIGSLILVKLKNKETPAIVLAVENIEKIKGQIKKLSYKLKPISKIIIKEPVIPKNHLRFIKKLADYYYEPLGLFLKLAIPQKLYKSKKSIIIKTLNDQKLTWNIIWSAEKDFLSHQISKSIKPILIHSFNYNQLENFYLEKIKKAAKTGKGILILFPENLKAERFVQLLNKFKVFSLFGDLTPKKKFNLWTEISNAHSPIVIGTRNAIFAPIKNLGLIIVDEEESLFYKSWDAHPHFNARKAALMLAKITNSELILGSHLPSVESHYLAREKIISHQIIKTKQRFPQKIIVDMTEEIKRGNYSPISYELKDKIYEALKKNEQILLFINRRGNATIILCQDCGFIFKCANCDVPLIHHYTESNNFYNNYLICHHCGYKTTSPEFCPECRSYKLKILGAGTQKIEKEIKLTFPKAKIARIDSDIIKKPDELNKIAEKFNSKKINILIGTQLMLKEDLNPAKIVADINIDYSLNFPDFNSGEITFRIIKKLESFTKPDGKLFIQTYNPEVKILKFAITDEIEDFYIHELDSRKEFDYPPFTQIIKAKFKHKNAAKAAQEAQIIAKKLDYFSKTTLQGKGFQIIGPAPAFIPRIKGNYIWQIIIKIPNQKILEFESRNRLLELIPSNWDIDVDPLSIL